MTGSKFSHLDRLHFEVENLHSEIQNIAGLFSSNNIHRFQSSSSPVSSKMSVSANQLHHKLNFLVCRITNTPILTDLSRSVWENLDLDRVHRPSLRSVRTRNLGQDHVFPYRPPARLIRANSKTFHCKIMLNHVEPPEIAKVVASVR